MLVLRNQAFERSDAKYYRHRAQAVDQKQREEKLDCFLNPLIAQWHTPSLSDSLSSFNGFCELLGLESLQQYALSRGMHRTHDWSSHPLDEEGRVLQSRIQNSLEVSKEMIDYDHQLFMLIVNSTYLFAQRRHF